MSARSAQCYLLLMSRMLQQSMRNLLSPMLIYMVKDTSITTAQKGDLLSAVAAGYLFTQIPGGALSERFGTKLVIAMTMGLSALSCVMMPFMIDSYGVSGAFWTIVLMGASQGPLFPTTSVVLSRWLPGKTQESADEKAWGTAQLDIGISVGALLIVPISVFLAETVGWRLTYQIIGSAVLLWIGALWAVFGASDPDSCWFITPEERAFLQRTVPKPREKKQASADASFFEKVAGVPFKLLLHPALWAIFIPHIAFNYGAYFMTNWNPTYYADVLKMAPSESALMLSLPHGMNLASKTVNPLMAKAADKAGLSLLNNRRAFTTLGLCGASLSMLLIPVVTPYGPWPTTIMFMLANTFFGFAPSGFKSNYLDVTVDYVGGVSGIGNTLGTVASWGGPIFVARTLEKFPGRWEFVFASIAALSVFAAAFSFAFVQVTAVEREPEEPVQRERSVSKPKEE